MRSETGDTPDSAAVTPEKPELFPELIFYNNHDLVIDTHRMLLPSEIRRSLVSERDGKAFFIVPGINDKPWFYTERRYAELARELRTNKLPGQTDLDFKHMYFAEASRQEWDKQWRIGVPEAIRARYGIGTVVTLAGVEDHLELWDREAWRKHQDELRLKRAEIFRAMQEKQSPMGTL
ncbi:MAG TPA: hypothetical protein VG326_01485 [Tepidisphaeraceae bacterium]|jgi:MraZ protein|nr:hypothetical protein [Tepidisphaeraceae bacterium]